VKLMRYSRKTEPAALARTGVLVGQEYIADLRAGHAVFLREERGNSKGEQLAEIFMPPYITQFLYLGEPGWEALAETHAWMAELARKDPEALGLKGERLFLSMTDCRLYAPVRPSKLIALAHNYPPLEGARGHSAPDAFLKAASAIVGPGRDIYKPMSVRGLDCEAGLAIVIGRKCRHVPIDDANDVIAGYTIVNHVTVRDAGDTRRNTGYSLLGNSLDTFAPLGPWLVTRDEIADPMRLKIHTRVNGELTRDGSTSAMLHSVLKIVSHLSQMTLFPGDVITTGSPAPQGLASERAIEAGDVLEAEIEGIGILRNGVVDEPR
jgi:2-keto-4-pentenoate hydratase/2-oxohepta-3-ene-1,7-dioic acid hydratase in catechol pathway